jgi:hypothetical protein
MRLMLSLFVLLSYAVNAQIDFVGTIQDGNNTPLNGKFDVTVKLLDNNQQLILQEDFIHTNIQQGKIHLRIAGNNPQLLAKISNKYDELSLAIHIDKQRYFPLVKIKTVNRKITSQQLSRPIYRDSYKSKDDYSNIFAIQAVTLQPQLPQLPKQEKINKNHAYTLPIVGPKLSLPLSALPKTKLSKSILENIQHEKQVAFDAKGRRYGTENPQVQADELAKSSTLNKTLLSNTPTTSINFEGINKLGLAKPADVSGAVGINHYIQMVNLAFAVFDKTGNLLAGPFATNSLWQGFGGVCEEHNNGDAIVVYDQQADRFVLSQFAINDAQSVCFAVSTTSDPMGTYYLYELTTQRNPDYYKLGIWPDAQNNAYYMGTNSGVPNAYDVYAIDRASLLAGVAAKPAQFFQGYANFLLPADSDGSLIPTAGTGGLFYTMIDAGETYFSDPPPDNDAIDLYEFKVNWDIPSESSFTLVHSFQAPEIADFNWTICGLFNRACLPQAGTTTKIDTGSWWPMQRFVYRNFGDHESLLGSWTVDVLADGDHAAPRWFEMRRSGNGQWAMYQQGTYAPDAAHRWMSSIAMNSQGDIGMVYNIVDDANNINPGIRFTSRRANEPMGQMRNESSLIEATGVQTSTFRWGDYSSMNVDPLDDCRFWMSAQYIQTTGDNSWNTRIGAFNFPDCVAVVANKPAQAVCAASDVASFDLNLTGNFTATTQLSLLGCPTAATCNFSVNPVIAPLKSSQLLLSNLSNGVAQNNYPLTVIATDSLNSSLVSTTALNLTVVDGIPANTLLQSPNNNANLVSTQLRTFQWSDSQGNNGYLFELATDTAFNNIIESEMTHSSQYTSRIALQPETQYFWRVTAQNICGNGLTSAVRNFISAPLPGQCETGTNPQLLYDFDFESDAQGWSSSSIDGNNSWQLSTANPDTGMQHWHITDVSRQSDTVLTSSVINLPAGNNTLTLHFNNAQDIESNAEVACWDGGLLEISNDGGDTFVPIAANKLLTDPYNGTLQSNSLLAGQQAWCGNPQAYLESIINLDDYANQQVILRFRLVTDMAVGFAGWDIDEVKIQSCANNPGILFANGFE